MSDTQLNERLCSAASFVRQRAVLADIGTDHAYLPIFLLKRGSVSRVYATDINEGPLAKAEENIRRAGLSELAVCRLTDGAAELSDLGITDYTICGMGGELIADIIDRAPHLKSPSVRLILQPMSKQEHLRAYLRRAGFSIIAEAYSSDSGKDYLCLVAEYTGKAVSLSELCSILPTEGCPLYGRESLLRYYNAKRASLRRAANGKLAGGESSPKELLAALAVDELLLSLSGREDEPVSI